MVVSAVSQHGPPQGALPCASDFMLNAFLRLVDQKPSVPSCARGNRANRQNGQPAAPPVLAT